MKKIINGKRYDTETAQLMAEDSYSNRRDFGYWSEKLYRKSTGEYFLCGEGGPASKYAETVGQNEWSGGEKIMPLSMTAAQKWAEEHLSGEEYEKIFGEVDESTEKVSQMIRLTPGTVEKLKRVAGDSGKALSDIVEEALVAYLS